MVWNLHVKRYLGPKSEEKKAQIFENFVHPPVLAASQTMKFHLNDPISLGF